MLKKEFREWLDTTYASQHSIKNPKVLGNYVSRIGRIEREYQRLEADFTLEKAYQQDGLVGIRGEFKKRGKAAIEKGINLPADTLAIYPYISALKIYQVFLTEYYNGK